MISLHILADLDSMAVQMMPRWLNRANDRRRITEFEVTEAEIDRWDHPFLVKNLDVLEDPSFWKDLPAMPGAVDYLKRMHDDGHKVRVCTSASGSPHSATPKLLWVKEHLPFLRWQETIITEDKHCIPADVFLDDSPIGIRKYREAHPNAWIGSIEYPYHGPESARLANVLAPTYRDPEGAWQILYGALRNHIIARS